MRYIVDPKLPSRYEDLDPQFRSKLRPVPVLNALVQEACLSMRVSGGIRFLPIYGDSGSGKSCAARELSTHFPSSHLDLLGPQELVLPQTQLTAYLASKVNLLTSRDLFIWIVDQYEEKSPDQASLPTEFVEKLSLLDRGDLREHRMLFIWLTTDPRFQRSLADATSRNARILVRPDFELVGPPRPSWPEIIEETFRHHNPNRELADFELIRPDIEGVCAEATTTTIGKAIEKVGLKLASTAGRLQDLSEYQVVMVWPVVDGTGIERVTGFTNPLLGYTLNWTTWYNRFSAEEQARFPAAEYNQARLYFDFRLVPLPVADLHGICTRLDDRAFVPPASKLNQLKNTHFYRVIAGASETTIFGTLREWDKSKRLDDARAWYETVTGQPTVVHQRMAACLTEIGFASQHEFEVQTRHAKIRADVGVQRPSGDQNKVLAELKLFAPAQTTPANIRDEIRKTLRKYAQLAGYIARQ